MNGTWRGCPGFELSQGWARVDPQFVNQVGTGVAVGAQCLGLTSGPVQGENKQFPQVLAQRVLAAQRLQFVDELAVAAQRKVGFGPGLEGHQGQLLEMCSFSVREVGVGKLGQWLPPPQPERFTQSGCREDGLPFREQAPSLGYQLLEAGCVEVVRADTEGIPGLGGDDRRRPEGATQLADLGLQGVCRVGRLSVTPQHVDEPVSAHRLASLDSQDRQQGPLLGAAYREYCASTASSGPSSRTSTTSTVRPL